MRLIPVMILLLTIAGCDKSGNDNSTAPVTPVGPTPVTPVDPTPVIPVDPNPEEGTILSTECEETTQVVEFADGNGGSTFERTEKSEECGYVEPEVVVEVVRREGDYFRGALISVTGDAPWDYSVETGNATVTDEGLEITSNGRLGVWNVTINDKVYQYEFVEEPKCLTTRLDNYGKSVDCLGNPIGGRTAPMIYYGEDDTHMVTIEIGVARTTSRCGPEEAPCADGDRVRDDHPDRIALVQAIEDMNAFAAKHLVYIRWELTEMVWLQSWEDIYAFGPPRFLTEMSDVVYGWGGSGSNGGQAFMPVSIYEGMRTPTPVGYHMGGNGGIFLHELGHAMGLGHGVWGIPNWLGPELDPLRLQGGSIFPWFGHGWDGKSGEAACGAQGSVMSYGSSALWTNSLVQCSTLGYPNGQWGDQAGSRTGSDEAYALNRVRYSYSLIHNEHKDVQAYDTDDSEYLEPYERESDEHGTFIED
jgi:hypothetical protein